MYERSVLITRAELAAEMLAAMGDADVVVLRGHGITVGAPTVEQATVLAVNLLGDGVRDALDPRLPTEV